VAQANSPGKPTTDFYHPSGNTGDPLGDQQMVAQASGCTVVGKLDSVERAPASGSGL
jgi:hypothetical protein